MEELVRPQKGRIIAGVAAGLANYFHIPATIVRIAFLLALLPGGLPGILLYVLLWIIMPSEQTTMMPKRRRFAFQPAMGRKGGFTKRSVKKKKTQRYQSHLTSKRRG